MPLLMKNIPLIVISIFFLCLLLACVLLFPAWIVGRTSLTPSSPLQATLPPEQQVKLEEIRLRAIADRLKAENDIRSTLLQGVAGLLLLAAALVTWQQFQLSRHGQITERFTRAIDQIDYTKAVEVRLGGIYALERIARDSPETDHWVIMEVLTAYVREHARWSEAMPRSEEPSDEAEPTVDIQAVLTVLGRRSQWYQNGEVQCLDLRHTDLQRAYLPSAHLEGANLGGAHLERANLGKAHLEGAGLGAAHLERAHLGEAHLEGASLGGAHLERAYLGGAHLERAYLFAAHLEEAYLPSAHLEGASLGAAHLERANLGGAHLERANLGEAHLEGAHLVAAHLEGADLRGAHLEGTDLRGAHLEGADLRGAHLEGAVGAPETGPSEKEPPSGSV
jgi:uncharacterized protein YjbI with pentapeptide repeats